jgi:hypothetical protein
MSVVRIDIPTSFTHGWQARWPISGTKRRLTAFYSDKAYGGQHKARKLAKQAERIHSG